MKSTEVKRDQAGSDAAMSPEERSKKIDAIVRAWRQAKDTHNAVLANNMLIKLRKLVPPSGKNPKELQEKDLEFMWEALAAEGMTVPDHGRAQQGAARNIHSAAKAPPVHREAVSSYHRIPSAALDGRVKLFTKERYRGLQISFNGFLDRQPSPAARIGGVDAFVGSRRAIESVLTTVFKEAGVLGLTHATKIGELAAQLMIQKGEAAKAEEAKIAGRWLPQPAPVAFTLFGGRQTGIDAAAVGKLKEALTNAGFHAEVSPAS